MSERVERVAHSFQRRAMKRNNNSSSIPTTIQRMEPQIHQLAPERPEVEAMDCSQPQLHRNSENYVAAPVSFDTDSSRGFAQSSIMSFHHENKHDNYFDCFLSSTPMHPIDSDDDCSVISALSFDDDITLTEESPLFHVRPSALANQDSVQTSHGHDRGGFESAPTVISSACYSRYDTCHSQDDDMSVSTTLSMLDDMLSLDSSLASHSSNEDPAVRDETCHFERLPDELICSIASYLDVQSLSRARLVNKRLLSVASQDEAGWKWHCTNLWSRKANVSKHAYSLLESGNARKAFYVASREAVSRHCVLPEELCFNPLTKEGIIWSFRFKATAGAEWTSWDPWWNGTSNNGRAQEMVFLHDGRVLQYIRGNDKEEDRLVQPFANVATRPNGLDVRWRFLSQPMDLPKRPEGAYLRLNIAGRDVPTYVVHRSPTGNWGFVMESCWGVYASFPIAKRKRVVTNDAAVEQRPPRMRLRRTTHGEARWLNVADMESDDEEETDGESELQDSPNVLEDSALSVTTAWQWREAILHNQGLVSLPEGESAAAEFDRAYWGPTEVRRGPN